MRALRRPALRIRAIALAALAGLCLAGCGSGSASAPAGGRAVECQLGPPWPLVVGSGSIDALAVEGVTCEVGVSLMTNVVADLAAGRAGDGRPAQVSGWNCLSYEGDQTTCLRGAAAVYGQYGLS